MSIFKKQLGDAGENAAVALLRRAGYRIVARNWSCPSGELDIVARRKKLYVFVEVRTRKTDIDAHPLQSVTRPKQLRVISAAKRFLREKKLNDVEYRFDVIAIVWGDGPRPEKIEHHENAFREGRG